MRGIFRVIAGLLLALLLTEAAWILKTSDDLRKLDVDLEAARAAYMEAKAEHEDLMAKLMEAQK